MTAGPVDPGGTLQDWLLANDADGTWHAIKDALDADEAAGITWGVYDRADGGRLVETHPSNFAARSARNDLADALDRDPDSYDIRPA